MIINLVLPVINEKAGMSPLKENHFLFCSSVLQCYCICKRGRSFFVTKTLQTIAGHSTIGMTMNHYVHAQPEKIKAAGKQMHDLLAG